MKRITLSILCLFTLSLFVTTPALAYSKNSISKIVNIKNNNQYYSIGEIRISEDKDLNNQFKNGEFFAISLPVGVSWNPTSVVDAVYADVRLASDRELGITMKNCSDGVTDAIVLTGLQIKAERSFVGDITLEIDGRDSAVTSSKSTNKAATSINKYNSETVTVLKVLDDFSALIGRENGEQYVIKSEEALGLSELEKKSVIILSSNTAFIGSSSYLQVPSGKKSLLVKVHQLTNKAGNTGTKLKTPAIYVNGEVVSFDTEPIIEAGVTLVPLRKIMGSLGAEVVYTAAAEVETITMTKGTQKITLKIGDSTAKVNDKTVTLQLPAKVVNDRTLVPLRFISEALGANVDYNEKEGFISIY